MMLQILLKCHWKEGGVNMGKDPHLGFGIDSSQNEYEQEAK